MNPIKKIIGPFICSKSESNNNNSNRMEVTKETKHLMPFIWIPSQRCGEFHNPDDSESPTIMLSCD